MNVLDAADGILRVAVTKMSYAVKGVSTERGLDAAAFALIAYGGAGPLHASAIAREIGDAQCHGARHVVRGEHADLHGVRPQTLAEAAQLREHDRREHRQHLSHL